MRITLDESPDFIRAKIAELVEAARTEVLPLAGNTMLGPYKDRIFDEGKDSNGADIGKYSTKEMYATPKQFVNKGSFKGVGKTGETKFKTGARKGQNHKAMYLPAGLKQLRDIQGRPTNNKKYNYSGSLLRSVQLAKNGEGYAIVILEQRESVKFRANEKRDGKVVGAPTEKEVGIFQEAFTDHFKIVTDRILQQ